MKRLAALVLVTACGASEPAERYSFLAKLGNDTVSVESVTRRGNTITSDGVDRFPRVRLRHTTITLANDGSVRRLEMDIRTPSEPSGQRERRVVADVSGDSVRITKRDSAGTMTKAFATGGRLLMPHIPQVYSLTDLYFAAAFKQADANKLSEGDSVRLHQYYIDREFDRFPRHDGVVKIGVGGKAELRQDWLASRQVHAVDRPASEWACRLDREHPDWPVGHGLRWGVRPCREADDDGDARNARREVHHLHHHG